MKVGFVHGVNSELDSVRGIGVHTTELVNALSNLKNLVDITNNIAEADILHITKFNPFFVSVPFFKKNKKIVLTIHDLIPLIYPKHYPSGLRGKINFLINKFLIWKNVDAIITISETSKKDICRFLNVSSEKVFVTYLGVKKIYRKLKNAKYDGLPKKFALYIGDINYNKNIPNLVKACSIAKMPLVIVGKQALQIDEINKAGINHPELIHLKNINWSGVVRLGFVKDEDLVKIVNLAQLYVQPSFYEGFGLSPLEALACGIPVVASKTQCLVEVLGDAADYFDPKNINDMAKVISNVKRHSEQKVKYTWEKCAIDTAKVYKSLVND